MDVGMKDDRDKRQWHLLDWNAIESVVKVLEFGAKKYGEYNWRSVPDFNKRYVNAALRHLIAYQSGEITDPESGLPHLAHLICNAMFLSWGEVNGETTEK